MRKLTPILLLLLTASGAKAAAPASSQNLQVVFDFKSLLEVPQVGDQLRQAMESAMNPEARQQLKAAGIDLFTSLETVELRARIESSQPDPRQVVILVKGRFQKAAANKMLASQKGGLKAKKVGRHTMWLDPKGQGMVIVDNRHFLAGHELGMRAQLKRGLKSKPLPSFLRGAHLAMRMVLPKSLRQQMRKENAQHPAADIEGVLARVTITPKRDLELKAQVRCSQPAAAQGLSMMVSMGVSNMTTQAPPPIAAALRSLTLRPQGKVLGLSLSLSESQLQAITAMAQQQMPGGAPPRGPSSRPARPATKR